MPITTIDDVISELTTIIDECWQQNSRLGYFPAMYRQVTILIKEGVENGRFDDGERMERLDVVFAQRYLDAYRLYRQGQPTTAAWAYAFERAEEPRPIILPHLLLGMNAHINLDLGIAAAQICHDCELEPLRNDFFAVNNVLAHLFDEIQEGVNYGSALFRWLDLLGGRLDEALGNFSLRQARQFAWERAEALHQLAPEKQSSLVAQMDQTTRLLANLICPPFSLGELVSAIISPADAPEPRQIIEALS
jgi:hypothetical protein